MNAKQTAYTNFVNTPEDDGIKVKVTAIKNGIFTVGFEDGREEILPFGCLRNTEKPSYKNGLEELKNARERAYVEQARYDYEFETTIDVGRSIGSKPVDKAHENTAYELAEDFPLAKLYLRAESYTYSGDAYKCIAGKDAMEIIEKEGLDGVDEATEILDNWSDSYLLVWSR